MNLKELHWKVEDIFSGMHRRSEKENKEMVKALYSEAIEKANNRIEKINNAWKGMRRFLYGAQFDLLKAAMAQGKIEKVQDEINQWEKEK